MLDVVFLLVLCLACALVLLGWEGVLTSRRYQARLVGPVLDALTPSMQTTTQQARLWEVTAKPARNETLKPQGQEAGCAHAPSPSSTSPPTTPDGGRVDTRTTSSPGVAESESLFGSQQMPSFGLEAVLSRTALEPFKPDDIIHDKWIVVTSVAAPTDDVKFLVGLDEWRVVVVGDSMTPSNWSLPECTFLDVAKQRSLSLGVVTLIPLRSYARKIVGYLYAVAHGAKVIYDTDDDNRPTDRLHSFAHTDDSMPGLMYAGPGPFNPYRHFGQPTMWPRGFPLSKVGADGSYEYRLAQNWTTPVIQQGAVNGDPDVDAIFRLTRQPAKVRLNVTFDPAAPAAILPEGIFCPYNAQNTLFLKKAFWSLYLPVSVTFRVTDIWRSYWGQRLLWETGELAAYFPPNAYQRRNLHDYSRDFQGEQRLYSDTEALLDFLYHWHCPTNDSFFQCVYRLSVAMAQRGFWGEVDVEGVRHWLDDLVRLGYPEPMRKPFFPTSQINNNNSDLFPNPIFQKHSLEARRLESVKRGISIHYVAAEQIPPGISGQAFPLSSFPALKQAKQILSICPKIQSFQASSLNGRNGFRNHFNDVLLIVIFNSPFYENVFMLEVSYRFIFPNIAYCGPRQDLFSAALRNSSIANKVTFVDVPDARQGYYNHRCVARVLAMGLNVTGYFFVGDDDLVNVWSFREFDKNRVWVNEYLESFQVNSTDLAKRWGWWSRDVGAGAFLPAYQELRHWSRAPPPHGVKTPEQFLATLASNIGPYPMACHTISDVFYIPGRLRGDARFYFDFFAEYDAFLEIVIPFVLRGIDDANTFELIKGLDMFGQPRKYPWLWYESRFGYIHPIKLSRPEHVKKMCAIYWPLLQRYAHGESSHMNITVANSKSMNQRETDWRQRRRAKFNFTDKVINGILWDKA